MKEGAVSTELSENMTSAQEERLFYGWRLRIMAGLPESTEEGSPRFELIQAIHEDLPRRHPLGIAFRLREALNALCVGDDRDAVRILAELERDELASRALNPGGWA